MNAYHYLVLNLTNHCNTFCRYCFQDSRPNKHQFLPVTTIKKCLDWCASRTDSQPFVQFTGGEPSIHPAFWEIFDYAKSRGFYIKFQTNGLTIENFTSDQLIRLAQPGVALKISLDGYNQSTHEFMRSKGTFDRIMAGIQALKPYHPRFAVKSVLSPQVAAEFQKMLDLSLAVGAVGISYNFLRPEGRAKGLTSKIDRYQFTERAITLFNQPKYKHLLNGTDILRIWMLPRVCFEDPRFYVNCDGLVYSSQKMKPNECLGNTNDGVECLDEKRLAPLPWEIPEPLYRLVRERLEIKAINKE